MIINARRILEQVLLTAILGGISMGVSYIAQLSDNIERMTVAIQLLTERLTTIDKISQDHETRIRILELRSK